MKSSKFIRSILIISLYGFAGSAFFPYITPYLKQLGVSDSNISFMYSIAPIFIMLIAPVMGRIADIVGRKRVVVWTSLFLATTVAGLLFLSVRFTMFSAVVFYTFYIVFSNVLETVAISMSEDSLNDNKKRGYFTGIFESMRSIFIVSGIFLGVYITSRSSIETVIFVSFLLYLVLVVYTLSLKKHVAEKKPKLKDLNFINDVKYFLRDRRLRLMGILGILTNFSEGIFSVFIPLYIITELNGPVYFVGIIVGARYLISILQFYFGRLCDIKGSGNMVFFGVALKAIALCLLPFLDSLSMLLLVSILISVGGSIWNTAAWSYMSQIGEDNNEEGEIAGSYISIAHIGPFLAYITGGMLVGVLTYKGLFLLSALICLSGAYLAYKKIYKSY